MLNRIGVRMWKVASGEVNNSRLFDYLIETRFPIMLSSGMSTIEVLMFVGENWPSAKNGTSFIQFTIAKKIVAVPTKRSFAIRCGSTKI